MRGIVFIYIFIWTTASFAQSGVHVFDDSYLHEIRITIGPENWFDTLQLDYDHYRTDPQKFPEISRPCVLKFDGVYYDTIGIRQRGNSSNTINTVKYKKPFKLEIDAFKNTKVDGLKNLILNNCTDDPSFVREALCYRLVRDEGVIAPRTAYAKVYINERYWGLYLLVENVDKTFLKDHFGSNNNDGNLYKTAQTAQAYLNKIDITDSLYKKNSGLELKTNNQQDDWTRLVNFINLLNHPELPYFKDSFSKVFDVPYYIKLLAIEKLVHSWDSYWANGNNYYLYEHPDGTIRWLAWDMNETFPWEHGLSINRLFGVSYLKPTEHYEERPLIKAIFEQKEWTDLYMQTVCEMMHRRVCIEYIDTIIVRWHNMIEWDVYRDTNKLYLFEDFDASIMSPYIHADLTFPRSGFRLPRKLPGIIPFIREQHLWAKEQMSFWGYTCEVSGPIEARYSMTAYPNPGFGNELHLKWAGFPDGLSHIRILNAEGKISADLYNQQSVSGKLYAVLPDLPAGVYWVQKIDAKGSVGSCKWVKF